MHVYVCMETHTQPLLQNRLVELGRYGEIMVSYGHLRFSARSVRGSRVGKS